MSSNYGLNFRDLGHVFVKTWKCFLYLKPKLMNYKVCVVDIKHAQHSVSQFWYLPGPKISALKGNSITQKFPDLGQFCAILDTAKF